MASLSTGCASLTTKVPKCYPVVNDAFLTFHLPFNWMLVPWESYSLFKVSEIKPLSLSFLKSASLVFSSEKESLLDWYALPHLTEDWHIKEHTTAVGVGLHVSSVTLLSGCLWATPGALWMPSFRDRPGSTASSPGSGTHFRNACPRWLCRSWGPCSDVNGTLLRIRSQKGNRNLA